MGLGIGRVTVAIGLGVAGVILAGWSVWDWRAEQADTEVVTEPAVDPEEVAAVIQWASSSPEIWRPETPAPAVAERALATALVASGGRIAVPDNARAGGGKVSAIPSRAFRAGRWANIHAKRVSEFTRVLNRTFAPVSSCRR